MDTTNIKSDDGYYRFFRGGDIESINPIKYYSDVLFQIHVTFARLELLQTYISPRVSIENVIYEKAKSSTEERISSIINEEIPESLKLLSHSQSKRDQEKLLSGLTLTSHQLMAFIFYAYSEHGFLFSQFTSEYNHNGVDVDELPRLIHLKDEVVHKVGHTPLTDGELKNVVKYKKVLIAKFIESATDWHCFFVSLKSLRGEENWNNGHPHFHYISNKFGMSKETVVKELKSRQYHLGSLPHIKFIR